MGQERNRVKLISNPAAVDAGNVKIGIAHSGMALISRGISNFVAISDAQKPNRTNTKMEQRNVRRIGNNFVNDGLDCEPILPRWSCGARAQDRRGTAVSPLVRRTAPHR